MPKLKTVNDDFYHALEEIRKLHGKQKDNEAKTLSDDNISIASEENNEDDLTLTEVNNSKSFTNLLFQLGSAIVSKSVIKNYYKTKKEKPMSDNLKNQLDKLNINLRKITKAFKTGFLICNCGFRAQSRTSLRHHLSINNNLKLCCLCLTTMHAGFLSRHMSQKHKITIIKHYKPLALMCSYCPFESKLPHIMNKHQKSCVAIFDPSSNLKPFDQNNLSASLICKFFSHNSSSLQVSNQHLKDSHENEKNIRSCKCNLLFFSHEEYISHHKVCNYKGATVIVDAYDDQVTNIDSYAKSKLQKKSFYYQLLNNYRKVNDLPLGSKAKTKKISNAPTVMKNEANTLNDCIVLDDDENDRSITNKKTDISKDTIHLIKIISHSQMKTLKNKQNDKQKEKNSFDLLYASSQKNLYANNSRISLENNIKLKKYLKGRLNFNMPSEVAKMLLWESCQCGQGLKEVLEFEWHMLTRHAYMGWSLKSLWQLVADGLSGCVIESVNFEKEDADNEKHLNYNNKKAKGNDKVLINNGYVENKRKKNFIKIPIKCKDCEIFKQQGRHFYFRHIFTDHSQQHLKKCAWCRGVKSSMENGNKHKNGCKKNNKAAIKSDEVLIIDDDDDEEQRAVQKPTKKSKIDTSNKTLNNVNNKIKDNLYSEPIFVFLSSFANNKFVKAHMLSTGENNGDSVEGKKS